MTDRPHHQRRRLLQGAAGVLAASAPGLALAQTTRWRVQSRWDARDLRHELARDLVDQIHRLSGPRLRIDLLPAAGAVPAAQVAEAVSRGQLDGSHGSLAEHHGAQAVLALWGAGPAFGMDANTLLAWHHQGGGKALLAEALHALRLDVVSHLHAPLPPQALGWFRKPLLRTKDLKDLPYQGTGLASELMADMGARLTPMPAADAARALQDQRLGASEASNLSSDLALGLPQAAGAAMLQSFHRCSAQLDLMLNRRRHDALPSELQMAIECAVQASSARASWTLIERNARDHDALRRQGHKFYKTPDAVLKAQLEAWDAWIGRLAATQPLVRRVLDSQQAFARRAVRWHSDHGVDHRLAENHYFPRVPEA